MENNALTPEAITQLRRCEPDEIGILSEQVVKADQVTQANTRELEHLSGCLNSLAASCEKYEKVAKRVRSQMSSLVTKI